ncbi:MAG: hypothetical protein J6V25_06905 [Oscillospiraceae bacterium]|nr:hypothetical protein [Oscillospiraceae bacterium]
MGHRIPLDLESVLTFDGIQLHISGLLARGSNSLLYQGWCADPETPGRVCTVLIRELFPYHPQRLIYRDPSGCIRCREEASALWQTHKNAFLAVNQARNRQMIDYPGCSDSSWISFCANGTEYALDFYASGRTLSCQLQEESSLREHVERMLLLLEAVESYHKTGILHLDIRPDTIMLCRAGAEEQILLTDCSCIHTIGKTDVNYLTFRPGYMPPELETASVAKAGFSSDLYAVAAIFFHCLMGRSLTLEELLLPKPPDGKGSPLLQNVPQPVANMAGKILKKGLHELPDKRYRSTGQMRQAFCELRNRIDRSGITRQALWEGGRRSADSAIRSNPALRRTVSAPLTQQVYLTGQPQPLSSADLLQKLEQPEQHTVLFPEADNQKHRLLFLQLAYLQEKRHSPSAPVVYYLPMDNTTAADDFAIRRQILKHMGFTPECVYYQSAAALLPELFSQPDQPVVLLLDTLSLDTHLAELLLLQQYPGIRILACSREFSQNLCWPCAHLSA